MQGFSLIEALIALLIITFSVLAIAGFQINSLSVSEQAYWQSMATVRMNAISERLRANHSTVTRQTACMRWNQINQTLLPSLYGECNCQLNACSIKLIWKLKKTYTKSMQVIL